MIEDPNHHHVKPLPHDTYMPCPVYRGFENGFHRIDQYGTLYGVPVFHCERCLKWYWSNSGYSVTAKEDLEKIKVTETTPT